VLENVSLNYVTRVQGDLSAIAPEAWNDLLARQDAPSPFMQHAYLSAMQTSQSAAPETGWTLQVISLWRSTPQGDVLAAACPLYIKTHSRGEYVFDHAWADAYQRHGLAYYPKALCAVPFTPVPGSRLLARSEAGRLALVRELIAWSQAEALSSLHLLFLSPADQRACEAAGLMARQTVQFHWNNRVDPGPGQGAAASEAVPGGGTPAGPYSDFDAFLGRAKGPRKSRERSQACHSQSGPGPGRGSFAPGGTGT
jgi:predicted N-acyltransferase